MKYGSQYFKCNVIFFYIKLEGYQIIKNPLIERVLSTCLHKYSNLNDFFIIIFVLKSEVSS